MPMIGEFDIAPESIVEEPLLEKGVEHTFLIENAERKEPSEKTKADKASKGEQAYPYINLKLKSVDNPSKVMFHIYSMSPKSLSNRSSGFSYKKFLDKIFSDKVDRYTTMAKDLEGLRIVATVKHQGTGDEAQEKIDSVIGRAE